MEHTKSSQSVMLVTGGHGLLGSRVVPLLAQSVPDAEIISVARREGLKSKDLPGVTNLFGDLRDESLWLQIPSTITHVFHLAAVIPWQTQDRYKAGVVTDNLLPVAHLVEHSRRWPNLRQVIYSSSVSVYAPSPEPLTEESLPEPNSLYGASKLAGEKLLHCLEPFGIRTVSLRLSSLYGAGQYEGTVLPIMVDRALNKRPIVIFGDGSRTQDFLSCEDAAMAILLSFQKQAQGVYNVGTGTSVNMKELAQTVNEVFTGGATPLVFEPEKADSDSGLRLDISKAKNELGFEPRVDLANGLRQLKQELTLTHHIAH